MPLPSLSPIALEILVPVAALLILAAAFLAVLFCAIVGAGLGRLLYLGARSCANRVLPIFAPIQSVVVGPKAPGTNRGTSERRPSTGTRLRRSRAPSLAPVSGAVNRRPRSSRGKGEEHEGSGHLRREILRQTEVPRLLRLRGALRRLRRPTLHRLLVNPETLASVECPDFRMYPEEFCTGGWQEPPPPDPSQGEAAKRARTF